MSRLLKIGFFGSDHFSINCLRHVLPLRDSHISQLEIITRAPKRSGRGFKEIKDVEIASFAKENDIPLLRADKSDEFKPLMTRNYDLAIAVSYGLLIPSYFLQSLKYGGLNVHPSLLPKYSGPAPLYRTLLNDDKVTGCTIQALHPTEFDKGDIFLQEKYAIKENETLQSLSDTLSTMGGSLLRQTIESRMFDPLSENHKVLKPLHSFSYANKIKSEESQIIWSQYSAASLVKRYHTLGPLYCFIDNKPRKKKQLEDTNLFTKRVIMDNIEIYKNESNSSAILSLSTPGQFQLADNKLIIKTIDGYISSTLIKLEGFAYETANVFIDTLKRRTNLISGSFS